MNNAGIKNSEDIRVLESIMDDAGRTVLAYWEAKPPEDAQAAFDAFTPKLREFFEHKAHLPKLMVRPHSWRKGAFASLKPLFYHSLNLQEIHQKITGEHGVRALVEFFPPGKLHNSGSLHADFPAADFAQRISGLTILRSGENARGGHFKFVNTDHARLVTPDPSKAGQSRAENFVRIADPALIQEMPINSYGMFLNPELYHQGTPVEGGYRCRITTSIPSLFW